MPNHLANETSPYLLQHAGNPVDWYPWGPEALAKARDEDKPIFLSVGYSACHWCHVMERESFESEAVAAVLNEHFVSIKVDREERPDLDQVYMRAVTILTGGHGGWPMSVFLTPELKPFFGGTYWPVEPRMGLPGFRQLLGKIIETWQTRRQAAVEQADRVTEHVATLIATSPHSVPLGRELLDGALDQLRRACDYLHGGFGPAPKFPRSMDLALLMRIWRRNPEENTLRMVTLNLDKMARGGIYDHLGGGFARYSVDQQWLTPHFEKMLYDNALLVGAYLDGYLVTGEKQYAQIARETLDYILRDMTDPEGGFHSSEDADSEGEEGKFYLWTVNEVRQALGDERAERFCYVYDVTEEGNFERQRKSILNLPKTFEQCAAAKDWDAEELTAEMPRSRAELLRVRSRRVRPDKDDKVLVSWNGLMIDSMARAAAVFDEPKYLLAATRAAEFILQNMRCKDGRLLHAWRGGKAKVDAFLDDYACLANALITLYEAAFDEQWIDEAVLLIDSLLAHFRDPDGGGFFFTAHDQERLIARNKEFTDSAVPSGNSMAAAALQRLGRLCGRADYLAAASETLEEAAELMQQSPMAVGQLLIAVDMHLGPMPEIAILGDPEEPDTAAALADLRSRYFPNRVIACRPQADVEDASPELHPIFLGKTNAPQSPTVYVCERFACQEPVSGKDAVIATWQGLAMGGQQSAASQ